MEAFKRVSKTCNGNCWRQASCNEECKCYEECECDEECECTCEHNRNCFVITKAWENDHRDCVEYYCKIANNNVCCKLFPCGNLYCDALLPQVILDCNEGCCTNCAVIAYNQNL